MRIRSAVAATTLVVLVGQVADVHAEVVMETVTVGNPGNAPDTRYETPSYGGVDYANWGDVARFANWLHNGQPSNDLINPDPGNNVNFYDGQWPDADGYTNGGIHGRYACE